MAHPQGERMTANDDEEQLDDDVRPSGRVPRQRLPVHEDPLYDPADRD